MMTGQNADPVRRPELTVGTAVCVAVVVFVSYALALYLELLGWRIVEPELSLRQAWSSDLVLGALRTTAGALTLGLVFTAFGLLAGRLLPVIRIFWVWWFGVGAALFLLLMAALVAWAPS